jgi:hypothetical protein
MIIMEHILTICTVAQVCYEIYTQNGTITCENETQLPSLEDATQLVENINITTMTFPIREQLWNNSLQCSLNMARTALKFVIVADQMKWSHLICNNSTVPPPTSSSSSWLHLIWIFPLLIGIVIAILKHTINIKPVEPVAK